MLNNSYNNLNMELFYNGFFKNSEDIMLIVDLITLEIVDSNLAACKYYGYPYDEMIKLKISKLEMDKEDIADKEDITIDKFNHSFKINLGLSNYNYSIHKNSKGQYRKVGVYISKIYLEEREYLLYTINDLSNQDSLIENFKYESTLLEKEILERTGELKKAKSNLRELNRQLKESNILHFSIIASSPEVSVFSLDTNYNYLEFNNNYKKVMLDRWGKKIEIGMSILEVIGKKTNHDKIKASIDRALSGESFSVIDDYSHVKLLPFFCESFWFPKYEGSQVTGLTCFSKDITDSIIAQEKLDDERKFTEAILESIPGILYVYDEEGSLVRWNKKHEEITGYSSEELKEKTLEDWFDEENLIKVSKTVEDVFTKGYGKVESKLLIKGGGSIDLLTNGVKLELDGKNYLLGVGLDISRRKKMELQILKDKKLLETTLISVGDGVISCDNFGKITFLNRVAENLTGWTLDEAQGKPVDEVFIIINEFSRVKSENIVKKVIQNKKMMELANHTLLISRDGIERPIEDSAAPIVSDDGEVFGAVLVFRDCTSRKEKVGEIEFLSYHDQLTGLYNRRYYEEILKEIDKEENLPLSIVMGDINGLKLINDSLGHEIGDKMLQRTADIMKEVCKNEHIIARLGGDEFIILLTKTDQVETEEIINKIKDKALKEKVGTFDISISFGYQTKTKIEEDTQEILRNTEDHMYRNKLSESWSMRSRIIEMLMNSLFEKSGREMLHSKRVGKICGIIAEELGYKPDLVNSLSMAGLMHDIGKIGVAESILEKEGNLTESEWKEIKKHPEIGYRILSSVNEFSEVANYILEHHERWDGKGYPRGLKGEEITLYARIIGIADSYDAMTKDRSYRKGLSKEAATEEIIRCSGTQFDPEIVKIFVEKVVKKID